MNNAQLIDKAKEVIRGSSDPEAELVYLIKFGSHLYGTNTPESDADYKGLYFPSLRNLVSKGSSPKAASFRTKTDNIGKNSADDVDFELWSVHHWLRLLAKGDTNAIDLLFSFTNKDSVIFSHGIMEKVQINPSSFIDRKNNIAYISYSYQQAKKYGIRGSKLELLESLIEEINRLMVERGLTDDDRLSSVAESLKEKFGESEFLDETEGDFAIAGKIYQMTVRLGEVKRRLQHYYDNSGERSKLAKQNKGIDWKAISHAVRCVLQTKRLMVDNEVLFPLPEAEFVLSVKRGEHSWLYCEDFIVTLIEEVKQLQLETEENKNINSIHDEFLFHYYLKCQYQILDKQTLKVLA